VPIEGFLNKVAAFYRTEVLLAKPERLNTFANESLWYVQSILGRETISEQEGKFYLVNKPDASNRSWMPSSIKTTAYFLSALIWTIPGTIARLLSFDSTEITAAVFADRITPPPPKKTKVPRPVRLTPSQPSQPKNNPEAPQPKVSALEPINNPLSTPVTFAVGAEARASKNINHHRIFNELESSYAFFTALNALPDNKIEDWLKKKEKELNYNAPFLFAFNLLGCMKENRPKIVKIIPEKAFEAWQDAFTKAAAKLQQLGLSTDNVEPAGEKNKPKRSVEDEHLDYILGFYTTFITLKTNRAEWLKQKVLEKQYRFPFFNALYLQGWLSSFNPPLDPKKIERLILYHGKCVSILYDERLEHQLAEVPTNLPPGVCAIVHCFTEHLTQPPEQPSRALAKAPALAPAPVKQPELTVSDVELKKLLILGAPILKTVPGLTAILENNRLFQLHKLKLVAFINNDWKFLVSQLTDFLNKPYKTPEDRANLIQSIEYPRTVKVQNTPLYKAPFSEKYLQLINTLQPILEETVFTEWVKLYQQCQERLRKLHLTSYLKEEIPHHSRALEKEELERTAEVFDRVIPFFRKFLIPANTATWLDQEARKESYCFPFFYSFDLQCKLTRLQSRLNQSSLSEWNDLYKQALSKIETLNLKKHLDEFPPKLVDTLVVLSDHILVGEYFAQNLADMLNSNEPSQGRQVIGTTRAAFSPDRLTADQWTNILEDPEKFSDLAIKMSAEATSFFEELDRLPDQREKIEAWLKSKASSANSYPFFFTRSILYSGRTLLRRYKKVITAKTVEKLEALHVRATCKLLGLGLTAYFDKKPVGIKPTSLDAQKAELMNKALQSHLLFLREFLSLEPKKAQAFLVEKEQVVKELRESIPRIFHWEKFADEQSLHELKNLFPQFNEKLHQLGHLKK
jgi:hypothetical protein